ncbi:MAG: hypothetical protein QNJ94_08000 [Alphaproteobacteria bacterium]|nr:hypothetical protein [Alphaproteobacteria bacterium]
MTKLPFRAKTATGDILDVEFPLHPETGDAVRVGQLVTLLLDAIDKDIGLAGETSNGDVLQAVAMTLAIRAGMIHGAGSLTETLSIDLLRSALEAVADATRTVPQAGHA